MNGYRNGDFLYAGGPAAQDSLLFHDRDGFALGAGHGNGRARRQRIELRLTLDLCLLLDIALVSFFRPDSIR
jgi:hypothetical protein